MPRTAQPSIVAHHNLVSGACGVTVENVRELFTGGVCDDCLIPFGTRTRRPLRVTHHDPIGRRVDVVLAQLQERPRGPSFRLYSEYFLRMLSPAERKRLTWREAVISNVTKTTVRLFEVVKARNHAVGVALRGGDTRTASERCQTCKRQGAPKYTSGNLLPRWANPDGDDGWTSQPEQYVSIHDLPRTIPQWYAFGEWTRGVALVSTRQSPWPKKVPGRMNGVASWLLGVVGPEAIE